MGCRWCWPWGCWTVSTVRPRRPLPGQESVPPPRQVALSCEGVGRCCWSCRTGCGQSSIRVAGPPPVAISNPGRIDPMDQRTGQALRTGGVLGAGASCDGIAFTHLSWAQIIPVVARRPAQPVHWCGYQGLYALFGLCANGARSSGRGQLVDLQGRVLLGRRHAARNSAGAPCLNRAANLLHALCSRYVGSGHLLRTLPLPAARSPAGRIRSIDRASPNRPTNERLRGGLCVLRTRSHARSEHRRTAPAHSPETVAPPSAAEAPESTSETPRPE